MDFHTLGDDGRGSSHDFRRRVSSESPAADHFIYRAVEPTIRSGQNRSIRRFPMRDHYNAVRKSDLYEYCGISKPLLILIAGLIIGPAKEGQEPDPDEGYCVAAQDVLAAMMGCSRKEACRQVAKFVRDDYLTMTVTYRNGLRRCKYSITPEQLKVIKAREMKKDAEGDYIRATRPKKARKDGHKNLTHPGMICPTASNDLSHSNVTDCPTAGDDLSLTVVPSFVVGSSPIRGRKGNPLKDFSTPTKGKKEKPSQQPPACSSAPLKQPPAPLKPSFLYDGILAELRAGGCSEAMIEAVRPYTKICEKLNNNTGGLMKALRTMTKNVPKLAALVPAAPRGDGNGNGAKHAGRRPDESEGEYLNRTLEESEGS